MPIARAVITVNHQTGPLTITVEGTNAAVTAHLADMVKSSLRGKAKSQGQDLPEFFNQLFGGKS